MALMCDVGHVSSVRASNRTLRCDRRRVSADLAVIRDTLIKKFTTMSIIVIVFRWNRDCWDGLSCFVGLGTDFARLLSDGSAASDVSPLLPLFRVFESFDAFSPELFELLEVFTVFAFFDCSALFASRMIFRASDTPE